MAAETPSPVPTPSPETLQYWCYHCDKRVLIETLANIPDVICRECKNGFVELIPSVLSPPRAASVSDHADDSTFGSQFLEMLRIFAQAARDEDSPPQPPSPTAQPDDDYLRIELGGWDNLEFDADEDDDDNDNGGGDGGNRDEGDDDRSDNENDGGGDGEGGGVADEIDGDYGEYLRSRRREFLHHRIRDVVNRTRSSHNRILDWAEILMGLEDNSIEFRVEVPELDSYIGNPEDYLDATGYDAWLHNLTESQSGRRGAPPAARSAVAALAKVQVSSEQDAVVCAICKDAVNVGEIETKLPCGHGYHEDCIVPWLSSRNTCPVCRFELATDDPEYEGDRNRRRVVVGNDGASASGGV